MDDFMFFEGKMFDIVTLMLGITKYCDISREIKICTKVHDVFLSGGHCPRGQSAFSLFL
jgi:hypothetical protein